MVIVQVDQGHDELNGPFIHMDAIFHESIHHNVGHGPQIQLVETLYHQPYVGRMRLFGSFFRQTFVHVNGTEDTMVDQCTCRKKKAERQETEVRVKE